LSTRAKNKHRKSACRRRICFLGLEILENRKCICVTRNLLLKKYFIETLYPSKGESHTKDEYFSFDTYVEKKRSLAVSILLLFGMD